MILPLPNFSSYTRVVSTLHCTTKSDFPPPHPPQKKKKNTVKCGFPKGQENELFIYLFIFIF